MNHYGQSGQFEVHLNLFGNSEAKSSECWDLLTFLLRGNYLTYIYKNINIYVYPVSFVPAVLPPFDVFAKQGNKQAVSFSAASPVIMQIMSQTWQLDKFPLIRPEIGSITRFWLFEFPPRRFPSTTPHFSETGWHRQETRHRFCWSGGKRPVNKNICKQKNRKLNLTVRLSSKSCVTYLMSFKILNSIVYKRY